jgi:hypothetical protein
VSRERSLQLKEHELMSQQETEYVALQDAQLERERAAAVQAEARKQQARRVGNIKAREKLEVLSRLLGPLRLGTILPMLYNRGT